MRGRKNKKHLYAMEFIIKFLLIFSLVLGAGLVFIDRETSTLLYDTIGYSFLVVSIIIVVLIFKFPESIALPKVQALKFKKSFKNNVEFIKYLDNNVSRIKYKKYNLNSYNNFTAYYYVRKGLLRNKVEYFVILENDIIDMSKQEFLDKIDKIRNKIIEDVERSFSIKVTNATQVAENYILLVNNETDDFKRIINLNTVGGYRYAVLICGYAFDSKILYVSNQKDGQYCNYVYIRNKFLKVMNLKMKDRIK